MHEMLFLRAGHATSSGCVISRCKLGLALPEVQGLESLCAYLTPEATVSGAFNGFEPSSVASDGDLKGDLLFGNQEGMTWGN